MSEVFGVPDWIRDRYDRGQYLHPNWIDRIKAMPKRSYTPHSVPCDYASSSIRWSIENLVRVNGWKRVYTLYVSEREFSDARLLVKTMNGELPPQLNIEIEPAFAPEEWCVFDGTSSCGSPGVT